MANPLTAPGSSPAWALRALATLLTPLVRRAHARPRQVAVTVALAGGRAWSRRIGPGGVIVQCLDGSGLLTREGDPVDRVLAGGDSLRSERHGRLALMALGSAQVAVRGDLR